MVWKFRKRSVDLSRSGVIMGILNVTPDSFSDGGQFFDEQAALRQAERMAEEGAAILDIGGESSRPGSEPVALEEELRRVVPVVKRVHARFPELILSIDTYKAETARQAVAAGADIVNDISALQADQEMMDVLKESGAGVVLMHMRGTPRTMQIDPHYEDVITEVLEFLRRRRDHLVRSGIEKMRIAIDPGYGFGKRLRDNVELIRHLDQFAALDQPVVVGTSRKSMIGQLLGDRGLPFEERLWSSVALTSLLREKSAHVFRVHDVRPNFEALRMTEAILVDA